MAYLLLFNSSETLGSVLGCLVESQPSAGLKVLVPDPHDVAEHFRKLFHKTLKLLASPALEPVVISLCTTLLLESSPT